MKVTESYFYPDLDTDLREMILSGDCKLRDVDHLWTRKYTMLRRSDVRQRYRELRVSLDKPHATIKPAFVSCFRPELMSRCLTALGRTASMVLGEPVFDPEVAATLERKMGPADAKLVSRLARNPVARAKFATAVGIIRELNAEEVFAHVQTEASLFDRVLPDLERLTLVQQLADATNGLDRQFQQYSRSEQQCDLAIANG